jgi:hypothetical protein
MKKLAVFFIVLIGLVVIAGCNNSKKTVTKFSTDESSENGTKTIITKVDEEKKTDTTSIDITAKGEDAQDVKSAEDVKFAVTSPSTTTLKSDKGYHLIKGTTPANTDKIFVNDILLSKYKAGSTEWNYIAAAALGTLKKGDNTYAIRAEDKDGNELGSETLAISYKGINGVLASTGNNGITLISLILAMAIGFLSVYARPLASKARD